MACCTIGAMCGGSLCPALPGYHLRALVVWDVRGEEVGPYPARRVLRGPPSAPFSFALAAPEEGVYLSAVGVPISTPLLRAACPRQNDEKCRDLEHLKGTPLYVQSQKPHRSPAIRKPLPRIAEG